MNLPEATFSTYLLCLLHRVVSTKNFSIKFLFTKNFSQILVEFLYYMLTVTVAKYLHLYILL